MSILQRSRLSKLEPLFRIKSASEQVIWRGRLLQLLLGIVFVSALLRVVLQLAEALMQPTVADFVLLRNETLIITAFALLCFWLIRRGRPELAAHTLFLPANLFFIYVMLQQPSETITISYFYLLAVLIIASVVSARASLYYTVFCIFTAFYMEALNLPGISYVLITLCVTLVVWVFARAQRKTLLAQSKLNKTLQERIDTQTADLRHSNELLQLSLEIGRSTSASLDLNGLLHEAVHRIRNEFGYYHVSIFLSEEGHKTLLLREATGPVGQRQKSEGFRMSISSNSIVGWASANRQPRYSPNTTADPLFQNYALLPNTKSELALPLVTRNHLVGALDLQSDRLDAFTQEDITTLQVLADQLANSIDNAQLFTQLEQRTKNLTELQSITSLMSSQVTTSNALLVLAERAQALIGADAASVVMWLDERKGLRPLILEGIGRSFANQERYAKQWETIQKSFETGDTHTFVNTKLIPSSMDDPTRHEETNRLHRQEEVEAAKEAIEVAWNDPNAAPVASVQSALNFVFGGSAKDEPIKQENPKDTPATPLQSPIDDRAMLENDEAAMAWLERLLENSTMMADPSDAELAVPTEKSPSENVEEEDIKDFYAWLAAPIKERNEPIGVLVLAKEAPGQIFDTEEVQLIELLVGQAGTIITNQRLIEESQGLVRRERVLNQISAEVRRNLDTEMVLESAAKQLGHTLGDKRVRVRLYPRNDGQDPK